MRKLNITFCSYPDFSNNAKALYEYMVKFYKNKMNFNWIVNDETSLEKLKNKGINAYLLGSSDFKNYIKTTDVFFTTHCNLTGDKTEKSLYVELWHGISSKKVGFMMNNISKEDEFWYKHLSETIDYFIVPSEFWSLIFASHFNINLKQILPIGYPKLNNLEDKKASENLSKLLDVDIKKYKKVIFYMPTFRQGCGRKETSFGNNLLNLESYNEVELIKYLKKNNYLLCVKKHPSEESEFLNDVKELDNIKIIKEDLLKKNDYDTYNVLNAADILITDYSSLGIEFLYLNKPVIYIDTDVEEYMKNRGICYNNFDFWSSSMSVNNLSALKEKLDFYLKYDNDLPQNLKEKRNLWFNNLEDGGCKNICSYFFTDDGNLRNDLNPYVNDSKKIVQLNNIITQKEEDIKYFKRLSAQRKEELNLVYNSKSWKILEKLRKVKRRILKK